LRSLLFLEFLGIFRRLFTYILIIIPSAILLLSGMFFPDRSVFIFTSIFVLQLLLLVSPILLSELMNGGWRLLYQAGILHEPQKIVSVILFSSIIITAPPVSLFTSLYFFAFHSDPSLYTSVSFLMIGLLSCALGIFFKSLVNDQAVALAASIVYQAFLLPSIYVTRLYPEINYLTALWPIIALMNGVINVAETQPILIESFIVYLLLIIASAWLLFKKVKL